MRNDTDSINARLIFALQELKELIEEKLSCIIDDSSITRPTVPEDKRDLFRDLMDIARDAEDVIEELNMES